MPVIKGKNILINGGNFNQTNSADNYWQKLYERVAKGALHDSHERSRDVDLQIVDDIVNEWKARFRGTISTSSIAALAIEDPKSPAPGLSLSVVEDVIKDVRLWLHDPSAYSLAMWLYDDKKACTSLVAQVVAEILSQRKELSATYFFPGNPTQDIHTVVPTIAYQLGRERPAVKSYISAALEEDIAILHSNLPKQMKKLVVNPLTHAQEPGETLVTSNVIVIHGIEDFEEGEFHNLDELIKALTSIQSYSFAQRLLIVGRPTPALRAYLLKLPEQSIFQRPIKKKIWQAREEDISLGQKALRHIEKTGAQARQGEELGRLKKAMAKRNQELEAQEEISKKRLEEVERREANLKREEEKLQQRAKEIDMRWKQGGKQGPSLGIIDKFFKQRFFGRRLPIDGELHIQVAAHDELEPVCIAVIGPTGSGKPQIVKRLKQGNAWENLGSEMLLVSPIKIDFPEQGRPIILIDTPEKDGHISWDNILTMVHDWLTDQRKAEDNKGFKLSGILYLEPIESDFTFYTPTPPLNTIRNILGEKVAENVLFVTTMWDKRGDEDQHKQMEVNFQHWKRTTSRMDRFDNKTTTAWRLVNRLLTGN